jgi:transposase
MLPLDLQKKGQVEDAASTTEEEFIDNLWGIIHTYQRKTGWLPVLSYDNVKIQEIVDISEVAYAQGEEGREVFRLNPALNKVDLPTYSPDMNRVIEHTFGIVKPLVRVSIYRRERDYSKGLQLQTAVVEAFHTLKHGAIRNDTKGLPLLWRVLSTPEGTTFEQPPGHTHVGTGGSYAPARYC